MAVSLNPVVGFSTKLRVKYQSASKSYSTETSMPKLCPAKSSFGSLGSIRLVTNEKRRHFSLSVADGDRLTTETTNGGSGIYEKRSPSNGSPETPPPPPPTTTTTQQEKPKRSPLTARERLRAARVLSRYNNTESTSRASQKPDLGSKVLDALRESDRGKKKGLPEAPGNMLDDSKRGLPPKGLTFQLPGGPDLFIIVFSFVFISTVMFATTFIVWKVGAIHFNEY